MPNPRGYLHGGVWATRGKLTGRLSTSEHPHCIEKEGLGDRAVLPLDGRVNGVQVLAGGTIPVLEGFGVVPLQKTQWPVPERKATSMNLGLHCLYMREAASSSFFLAARGVMARTKPKRI